MKTFTLVMLCVMMLNGSSAQNLVNNPGFENISSCPLGISEIHLAVGWSSWNNTSDLFHVCHTPSGPFPGMVDVPINWFGYQYPRSGSAYAGFHAFAEGDAREALGTQLNQPLIVGQKYFVKFFVSRAHSLGNGTLWGFVAATNKLGALFTTFPYSFPLNPSPVNNFAHVYSDSVIADSTNWVLISGSFIADSAYTYVGFGHFFTDSATTVAVYGIDNPYYAYYFIDDVSVSTDSLYTTGIASIDHDNGTSIYPNPFNENLSIQNHDQTASEFLLYDIVGRVVMQSEFNGFAKLSTRHLVNGVYLYEIRNKKWVVKKGKVMKE